MSLKIPTFLLCNSLLLRWCSSYVFRKTHKILFTNGNAESILELLSSERHLREHMPCNERSWDKIPALIICLVQQVWHTHKVPGPVLGTIQSWVWPDLCHQLQSQRHQETATNPKRGEAMIVGAGGYEHDEKWEPYVGNNLF